MSDNSSMREDTVARPNEAAMPNAPASNQPSQEAQEPEEWTLLEPEDTLAAISEEYSDQDRSKAQAVLDKAVKEYFEALTERWKSEMDALLVYAALFSAILTAFNVELYKLLQPRPMDDAVEAIRQLSQQLNSFSISHPFVNSTERVTLSRDVTTPAPFSPPQSIVAINTLWFSSLVFSLASASLALLVKQWLYELTYRIPSTSREGAQLRQHRLDNLEDWHISTIIAVIPLLLQAALTLFLVGLVVLLWSLQDVVAAVTTLWVAALFIFLATFTILPAFNWRCSYRSPQAHIIYALVRAVHNGVIKLAAIGVVYCTKRVPRADADPHNRSYWPKLRRWFKRLSSWTPYRPWEARERAYLSLPDTSLSLDVATGARACTETLDPTCLDNLRIALSGKCDTLGLSLARCLQSLGWMANITKSNRAALLMRSEPHVLPTFFHYALRQMLAISRGNRHAEWEQDAVALRDSFYKLYNPLDYRLNDMFLNMNFMVAMEARSPEVVHKALTYLADAVDVTGRSLPPPRYLTLSRVLSAAVQWLERGGIQSVQPNTTHTDHAEPDTPLGLPHPLHLPTIPPTRAPDTTLLAFSIVAHCIIRVVEKKVKLPASRVTRFRDLFEGATSVLLGSLPGEDELEASSDLRYQLLSGLHTLIIPLVRLSRDLAGASVPQSADDMLPPIDMTFLIQEHFVSTLEVKYNTAALPSPKVHKDDGNEWWNRLFSDSDSSSDDEPALPAATRVNGDGTTQERLEALKKNLLLYFQPKAGGLPFENR